MSTKGFLLLIVTVIVIGGSVGGAFAGGLALGRSQGGDTSSDSDVFQQRFGGGQFPSGGLQGGQFPSGGLQGGQFPSGGLQGGQIPSGGLQGGTSNGNTSDGSSGLLLEESPADQGGFTRPGDGTFGGRGGFGGFIGGTVGTADGNGFSVSTQTGENQVTLDENSVIQIYTDGTKDDLSPGARVSVTVSGDAQSGEPVGAASVILNPPEGGGAFRGPGGFRNVLSGTIGTIDGNAFTVTTDSGEIQVMLNDDSIIRIFSVGTADEISSGDQVLVIASGETQSGEPVAAASVIVNPPVGGGIFGGGGFGGRPRGQ